MDKVISVPPRRRRVIYKGLHGWIEYVPSEKAYRWTFKVQLTIKQEGIEKTESKAELELKRFMEKAAVSKNVISID